MPIPPTPQSQEAINYATHSGKEGAWDKMTDQQRIEWLAVKMLGWENVAGNDGKLMVRVPMDIPDMPEGSECATWTSEWNPLTDWNHWRQVEEKVMEDASLWYRYILNLNDEGAQHLIGQHLIACVMKADLPTRARALYLSFHQ